MTVTEHRCLEYDADLRIFSACHPVSLPRAWNSKEQRAAILAAWTVLLRDYYAPNAPEFVQIGPKETKSSSGSTKINPEILHYQKLSVPIEAEATGAELKNETSQAVEVGGWKDASGGEHKTAVLFWPNEQVKGLTTLIEQLGVEVLLVVSDSDDCLLYVDASKRPEFMPCGILKSFIGIQNILIGDPATKVSEISTVTSLDIERMRRVNGSSIGNVKRQPECLHVLINKQYSRRPESIALTSTSVNVTYSELGKRSAAVSHFLTRKGVRAGDTVGICMERSVFTIISIIGILRAGAAYAPMDPSYPLGRISQTVDRADIKVLITEDRLCDKFQELKTTLITENELKDAKTPEEWSKEAHTDSSKPVYFMFTSGSTGVPKGVVHGHAAVYLSLLECIEALSINASTRFMQTASLAFDASILEVFAPLAAGGCLCMVSQEERNNDLESVMENLKVSNAWLTPSMVPQIQPTNLPSLRSLGIGGEPASKDLVSTWGEKVELNFLYGTTEAGVWDTLKRGVKPGENPKSIGRGIGNVACWITDPSNVNRLMPFGAEGELLVQSPYLALGYLKDLERQKQTLLDPSALEWASLVPHMQGSRVYRTGDLAKYDGNGEVVLLGRQTGYVKIRGLRVDLGEVENAINTCPEIARSAVILSENEGDDPEIAAYLETTESQSDQLPTKIHEQLSEVLPPYMIPAMFLPIESMPLNVSKKIDRQKLRGRISQMNKNDLQKYRKGGSTVADCPEIPDKRSMAIDISNIIADMFESKDQEFAASLRGKDFSLVNIGLTSMQMVSLLNLIRKKYEKKLNIEDVQRNSLTVCAVEDCITGRIKLDGQPSHARNLMADLAKLKPKLGFVKTRQVTVFLTSITGFLGSQVLRSLLENPEIKCVIGLVRARNTEQARQRVQQHGELGRWWKPEYQNRIEPWTGDLNKPNLGLDESNWERLFSTDEQKRIDGIIHNGARVHWMDTYEDLERVNVHSTVAILSRLSKMEPACPLVYVSGGYMPMEPECSFDIAKKLSKASGYDQTKFMSQLLLAEYNKHLEISESSVAKARTVIPGFIVGTQKEGIAHTEDFLWRLAFSIIRLKAVSEELNYLTVAGVDQVSDLIVDVFLQSDQHTSEVMSCVDGVTVPAFCEILSKQMQTTIKTMNHQEWMQLLKKDIEDSDFDHPFMPILGWFEKNIWQFQCDQDNIPENRFFNRGETIYALNSSVSYLFDIGYLSTKSNLKHLDKSAVLSRSSS